MTKPFDEWRMLVDCALKEWMLPKGSHPALVHEAMHYSLFAGGKRIRPILCMAAALACGGEAKAALAVACAMEMIHTFSLIHDDLPAMDNDNLRRGQPTNHRVYGDAVAILAGDGLLAHAFQVLSRGLSTNPDRALKIIEEIARATGAQGMVGGQVLDMEAQGKQLDQPQMEQLHSLKTGRLITASLVSGALVVTEDPKKIEALRGFGDLIGLAFQIADDVLDVEGVDIGKDLGSDAVNGKSTYVTLLGLEGARQEAHRLCERAVLRLSDFGNQAHLLKDIAHYIVERKK